MNVNNFFHIVVLWVMISYSLICEYVASQCRKPQSKRSVP